MQIYHFTTAKQATKGLCLAKNAKNKLGTLDEKRLDELAQKIPILNLKSLVLLWVRSFILANLT